MMRVTSRSSILDHKARAGNASWKREYARLIVSDSVVDQDVAVWRFITHATGNHEMGPARTKKPPDVDFVSR